MDFTIIERAVLDFDQTNGLICKFRVAQKAFNRENIYNEYISVNCPFGQLCL